MTDVAPLTPKGEATRQRILDAATAEFSRRGIAGARVDRIAAAARTNKSQLYAYFGSKEKLFDEVFRASLDSIMDVVPIRDASDIADWAVRLYDEYIRRPDLIRLATWVRLERRPSGHLVPDDARRDDVKLTAIAAAQHDGTISSAAAPFDIMAMVIAMSMAWSPVSNVYAASDSEDRRLHDARRELLRTSVRQALMKQ